MNWKEYFGTSIGKKLIMGFTGAFLMVFLVVHCYVNAQIFYNDGGKAFIAAADFMGTNMIIRIVEIGLFALLIWHMILGLKLYFDNRGKRARYEVSAGNKTSRWYSRSMALLGTLILMFLVLHLKQFWLPNRLAPFQGIPEPNLYEGMKSEFKIWWVLAIYFMGLISLAWHLMHGFYSAMQTFGLQMSRYKSILNFVGVAFSVLIPLIFATMPLAFFFGLLN